MILKYNSNETNTDNINQEKIITTAIIKIIITMKQ